MTAAYMLQNIPLRNGKALVKALDEHDMYVDTTKLCSNARNSAIIDFGLGIALFVNIQS